MEGVFAPPDPSILAMIAPVLTPGTGLADLFHRMASFELWVLQRARQFAQVLSFGLLVQLRSFSY